MCGLGARGVSKSPGLHHRHPAFGGAVRERAPQRQLDHLAGRPLLISYAGWGRRNTTAGVMRGPGAALAGATCPLLLVRLGSPAGDLGPGLGALGAGPRRRQLGRDHLVHEGDIRLKPENLGVELHGGRHRPGLVAHDGSLEPRPAPETCTNKRDPYRIRLENLSLWVMDSADDKNISSSLSKLENTLQPGEWLLSHRPLVTPEVDDESTLDIAPSLPLRLQIPGNLGVVMAGHIHTTMLNQFTDARPPELISGNGGTLLDKPAAVVGSLSTSQKEGYASTVYSDFGYVTLEQKDDTSNWDYIVRDKMGNIVTRCELRQEPHRKTLLLCNPLGNPLGNPLN